MSRVKGGPAAKARHRKVLKQTKGFWGQRKNVFKRAKETLMRALRFAYIGRKHCKRDFRSLFISRIGAACKMQGTSYSSFMHQLKTAHVDLNRKMLSQLAIFEPDAFTSLVNMTKK